MKRILTSTITALSLAVSVQATEVIATVNGEEITQQDVQSYMQQMPQQMRQSGQMDRQKLLGQLVQKELLTQYALKEGITKDEQYQKLLDRLKRDLALEVWMGKQMDSVSVSDKEVKEYYENNKGQFEKMSNKQVRARHILVESKEKAQELIDQLQGSNNLREDFIAMAKEHSTGPSAKNGGDLGFFGKGKMVPAFDEVVFDMKKGELTKEPVKSEFGHHVIYMEDHKDKFDVVKPRIQQTLRNQKFGQILDEVTKEQKKDADIKTN